MLKRPTEKIKCYFIFDISLSAYLLKYDPSEELDSGDRDHLYKEITEGFYYPVENDGPDNERNVVGYFFNPEENEFLCFYDNEFWTDGEWQQPNEKFLNAKYNWDKKE
ncbi:hypothetical protein [Bacillus toyonensis]|uniref:hypothetical protein n=1 Tax=Bacillus toyonensis TaxID=155322 RepID=UPI001C013E0C|nr:hypothetical protein [Bacillus toyonensis]QWG93264.1 hypothetical protein EXW33_00215 [Bacillus toyonensis]